MEYGKKREFIKEKEIDDIIWKLLFSKIPTLIVKFQQQHTTLNR